MNNEEVLLDVSVVDKNGDVSDATGDFYFYQ